MDQSRKGQPTPTPLSTFANKLYPEHTKSRSVNDTQTPPNPKSRTGQFTEPGESEEAAPKAGRSSGFSVDVAPESNVLQEFVKHSHLENVPHDGVPPTLTMGELRERVEQRFTELMTKLPAHECSLLEKDIGLEKGTIAKLAQMAKEGKNFEHYGLTPHADDQGYLNTKIINKKSVNYQRMVWLLESDKWRAFTDKLWMTTGMVLTGNSNRPRAIIEKERSEWVLKGLIDAFDRRCKKQPANSNNTEAARPR